MILSNKRITKALIRLHRLVCAFVVHKLWKTGFLTSRSILAPAIHLYHLITLKLLLICLGFTHSLYQLLIPFANSLTQIRTDFLSVMIWIQTVRYSDSVPESGNCCHLLITFANSLDPDQDRQNVCPDLDPNCLTL